MIEQYDDGDRCQDSLDEPGFHDDSRFIDPLFLKQMMQRCDQKEFSFEIFFPENLEKARAQIYDEEDEEDEKRDDDAGPHVEEIEQRSDEPSQSERSAITHEYLGGMDIVEHERHQHGDDNRNYGRSDIGLIEE